MVTRSLPSVLHCLPLLFLPLLAPPAPAHAAGDVADVVAVEVPVRVFRDGEPVTDLTASDFELRDRGRRQEITGFEVMRSGAGEAQTLDVASLHLRRRFLLLFDLAYSRPASVERAQRVALDFVRGDLRPTDLVAVGVYTADRGVGMVLGFTPDREQAAVAIESLGLAGLVELEDDPLGLMIGTLDRDDWEQAELAEHLKEASRFVTQAERRQRTDLVLAFATAMEQLGEVVREVPGRKDVLLFSEGWDASLLFGTEDRDRTSRMAIASATGEYWNVDSDERFGDSQKLRELEESLGALRRVGVAIQAVDLSTGVADPDRRGRSTSSDSLHLVSSITGGDVYRTGAADATGLAPLLERTGTTYLLTFQPSRLGDPGDFHRLEVKLAEGAGTVLHRTGYFVPRPFSERSLQDQRIEAANLLVSGDEGGPLSFASLAVPVAQPEGPPWTALLVEIDGQPLLEGLGRRNDAVQLELYGYAFDESGGVADHFAERWGLALDQVGDTLERTGVKYFGHLDLPPGEYRLHLLARDGVGRRGLRILPLTVPELAPGERGGPEELAADVPGRWVVIRENAERQAARSVEYPFLDDGQPFVPAVTGSGASMPAASSTPVRQADTGADTPTGARPLVLVPPRERPARGRTRLDTVVSDPAVARVSFSVDGEPAGDDRRHPFRATVDLGDGSRAVEVAAAAYDRDDRVLGEDRVVLNRESTPFEVAITRFDRRPGTGDGSGSIEVDVQVSVPPDRELDRVEVYRGDELVATSASNEVRTRVAVPSADSAHGSDTPADYVRAVARLADGDYREDVRLLRGEDRGERLEVRLVQLFVVVTDEAGRPVEGLRTADFTLRRGESTLPIERAISAAEVPLTLGLLLDSSRSMAETMLDSKLAAASFLRGTLAEDDRAFLVDFDDRPRLAVDATGDADRLERALSSIDSGGATALVDSLVFALGRLGAEEGRRALVLLSDGEDEGSRFRASRAVELARADGVPIYTLSLAEAGSTRLLDRLSSETGGRSLVARTPEEVRAAFELVERELRTQYVLLHAPDAPLDAAALSELTVEVNRDDLEARTLPIR